MEIKGITIFGKWGATSHPEDSQIESDLSSLVGVYHAGIDVKIVNPFTYTSPFEIQ